MNSASELLRAFLETFFKTRKMHCCVLCYVLFTCPRVEPRTSRCKFWTKKQVLVQDNLQTFGRRCEMNCSDLLAFLRSPRRFSELRPIYRLLFACVLQYLVASKQVKACPVPNVRAKYQLWIAKPLWVFKVYFQDVFLKCYGCQTHAFPHLTVPLWFDRTR